MDVRDGTAEINMVLTTQACPWVGYLTDQVKRRIEGIEGIDKVNVVVLDEPWDWARFVKQRDLLRRSEAARLISMKIPI